MMAKTLKALSAILNYPTEELKQAMPELRNVIAGEGIVTGASLRGLDLLFDDVAAGDLYDLQEGYVLLFDRTRSLSLHLFEHVHGESRDRGQAMIDLKTLYESNGLAISATELPDFLPLFLEYLSTRPLAEAAETLGQTAHILSALAERLRKRGSPYEAAFQALLVIAAAKPDDSDVDALLQEPDPDAGDLAALDAAWEDEPVTFGPGASSCKDGVIARIRAARRPVTPPNM
jgi:nitrate reductase molybdenum cofactor assembly chaperone NarJ/NarW